MIDARMFRVIVPVADPEAGASFSTRLLGDADECVSSDQQRQATIT